MEELNGTKWNAYIHHGHEVNHHIWPQYGRQGPHHYPPATSAKYYSHGSSLV